MTAPVQEKTAQLKLTAADRCDRCGAQAKAEVTFTNGPLLFCNHHFTQNKDKFPGYVLIRE